MKREALRSQATSITVLLAAAVIAAAPSAMASPEGEATYKAVCAVCHTSGAANAPKLGDKKKWAPLIREGQAILTAHGYVGIRGMPPKGGKPDLSLEDFSEAVVYMVNQSGGQWSPPDQKMLGVMQAEVVKREKALAAKAKK